MKKICCVIYSPQKTPSATMSWLKIATPEPNNLQDIISEELAKASPAKEVPHPSAFTNLLLPEAQDNIPGDKNSNLQMLQTLKFDDLLQITEDEASISTSNTSIDFGGELFDFDSDYDLEEEARWRDWEQLDAAQQSKLQSKQVQSQRRRLNDKNEPAVKPAVDSHTKLRLHKVISRELLDRVTGVICVGEKAAVLPAGCPPSYPERTLLGDCVLKVFNAIPDEFTRWGYCFGKDGHWKSQPGTRKVRDGVHYWTEKESRNLYKMRSKPARYCNSWNYIKNDRVYVSVIAENYLAGPEVWNMVNPKLDEYVLIYSQVTEAIKAVYGKPRLSRDNLSEYTILEFNKQCYFIDVNHRMADRRMYVFPFLNDRGNSTKLLESEDMPRIVEFRKPSRYFN